LDYNLKWWDRFVASVNNERAVEIVSGAVINANFKDLLRSYSSMMKLKKILNYLDKFYHNVALKN
jgi:hypothetical protein